MDQAADKAPGGSGTGIATRCPQLVQGKDVRRRSGDQRRRLRAAFAETGYLSNLGKTEKVRYHRFSAPVLVGTIGMQAVATTARFQIDEGDRDVVAAEEPGEYACSLGFP